MESEREACEVLKNGGVIVHPTEAVFGLAGSLYDYGAFEKISLLKKRPVNKKFIILVADADAASELVDLNITRRSEILASWPGPNTWVLPAREDVPFWVSDSDSLVALRVTAHQQCRKIIENVGPILSTSANRAGTPPSETLDEVEKIFGNSVDFYLDGILGGLETVTGIKNGLTGETLRK